MKEVTYLKSFSPVFFLFTSLQLYIRAVRPVCSDLVLQVWGWWSRVRAGRRLLCLHPAQVSEYHSSLISFLLEIIGAAPVRYYSRCDITPLV